LLEWESTGLIWQNKEFRSDVDRRKWMAYGSGLLASEGCIVLALRGDLHDEENLVVARCCCRSLHKSPRNLHSNKTEHKIRALHLDLIRNDNVRLIILRLMIPTKMITSTISRPMCVLAFKLLFS
jgi:hypothetical protein